MLATMCPSSPPPPPPPPPPPQNCHDGGHSWGGGGGGGAFQPPHSHIKEESMLATVPYVLWAEYRFLIYTLNKE